MQEKEWRLNFNAIKLQTTNENFMFFHWYENNKEKHKFCLEYSQGKQ